MLVNKEGLAKRKPLSDKYHGLTTTLPRSHNNSTGIIFVICYNIDTDMDTRRGTPRSIPHSWKWLTPIVELRKGTHQVWLLTVGTLDYNNIFLITLKCHSSLPWTTTMKDFEYNTRVHIIPMICQWSTRLTWCWWGILILLPYLWHKVNFICIWWHNKVRNAVWSWPW